MLLETRRFVLRDFLAQDWPAFAAYQTDPRYAALYDLDADAAAAQARSLFERFIAWQSEVPRLNFQLGIFERRGGRLCGSAGLRLEASDASTAELGIELTPDDWGRYRLAIEVSAALIDHGFDVLGLEVIRGSTASGNRRIEKLARWFGAELSGQRQGPVWMVSRGWAEVDWTIRRQTWLER